MPSQLPDDAPSPRLCLIVKTVSTQEYGYNLHAEKGKPQFIGTVDAGSPADRGGLRPGDRIFAVNGHSIIGENHRQVVQRIKENPLQCELLVISEEGAEWYKRHNIPITLSLPNVIRSSQANQHGHERSPFHSIGRQHHQHLDNASLTPAAAHWYAPKGQDIPRCNISSAKFISSMTNVPKPRLCRLRKHDPTEEFGFNLHAEKNRGHFVGAVDKDGIGERAGLQMGQRIVGVNGQLIFPSTAHKALGNRQKYKRQKLVGLKNAAVVRTFPPLETKQFLWYNHRCSDGLGCEPVLSEQYHAVKSARKKHDIRIKSPTLPALNLKPSAVEVVSLIKKNPLHTELLVASEEVDQWYTENHVEYSFDRVEIYNYENGLSSVKQANRMDGEQSAHSDKLERSSTEDSKGIQGDSMVTPHHNDASEENAEIDQERNILDVEHVLDHEHEVTDELQPDCEVDDNVKVGTENVAHLEENKTSSDSVPKVTASVAPLKQETESPHPHEKFEGSERKDKNGTSDIFKLSADEARSRLVSRKKDPRRDVQMSLEEKYQLVSNM